MPVERPVRVREPVVVVAVDEAGILLDVIDTRGGISVVVVVDTEEVVVVVLDTEEVVVVLDTEVVVVVLDSEVVATVVDDTSVDGDVVRDEPEVIDELVVVLDTVVLLDVVAEQQRQCQAFKAGTNPAHT